MLNYEDEYRVDMIFCAADEWEAYCRDMEEMGKIQDEALAQHYSAR